MAGYKLNIKNNEETITFSTEIKNGDKQDITKVSFKMNTLDDMSRNRSDAVRAEVVIIGNITVENRDNTKKLAKWSMDANRKTLYRDVELVVYDSDNCSGDVLRRYEISTMFVLDYEENFESADSGIFTLFIAQKDGSDSKEVFSS